MRILGLDIGEKRIGAAISDELETISKPLKVIKNDNYTSDKLKKIIDDYSICKIIIGIPYTLKGEIGFQAKKIIDFVNNTLKEQNLEIIYVDERFTSKISKSLTTNYKKNSNIDEISACLILESYLNQRKNEGK